MSLLNENLSAFLLKLMIQGRVAGTEAPLASAGMSKGQSSRWRFRRFVT